ncbi:MAG: hypothetical protein K2X86_14130 [Cytophagaceae bacterium]|nr:hypothetical protein [Cytophagaceae bacterium]
MAKRSPEEECNLILALLKKQKGNILVEECLSEVIDKEAAFSTFSKKGDGASREHIFEVYNFRASMEAERTGEKYVTGFELLLPQLKTTQHEFIKISDFATSKGTYIIFTDFEVKDFIGILKSNRTLDEIKARFKKL